MGAFDSAKDLPRHPSIREYAFAGRSNVGKSSLLNALAGEKIARVSNTPGRTRTLNLFNWDDRIWLMDLPGYGYARVSKADQAAWLKRLEDYLSSRAELKKLFVLIDSRVGMKEADEVVIDFCKSEGIPFQIVYTKCDKRASGLVVRDSCGIVTSATKKTGIGEVRKMMT
jgi:GTP-binding protein